MSDPSVLFSGDFWTGFAQTPTPTPIVVTFSFPTVATGLPTQDDSTPNFTAATPGTFVPFSAAEQAQAIQALAEWAGASQITFVQVAPGQGDINFSNVDFSTLASGTAGDAAGEAYNPFGDWNYYSKPNFTTDLSYAGNVFMNTQDQNADGTVAYATLLHEIGHAIGLKHPAQTIDDYATGVFEDNTAPDDPSLTIMSTMSNPNPHLLALDQQAAAAIYGSPGTGTPGTPGGSGEVITSPDGGSGAIVAWSWNSNTETLTPTPVSGGTVSGSNSVSSWTWDPATQTMTQTATPGTTPELLHGTSVADVITANNGTDSLFGLDGANTLIGGKSSSSNDTFYGGPTSDTMTGGAGTNTFYAGSGTESMTGGAGTNTFYDDVADAFAVGSGGVDTIVADGTNDTFYVGSTRTQITENNADGDATVNVDITYTMPTHVDTMNISGTDVTGTANNDANVSIYAGNTIDSTLIAGSGADYIVGGDGDMVMGGTGADSLFGDGHDPVTLVAGSGADYIAAGATGTDRIVAGTGPDLLYGTADGVDTFVFGSLSDDNAGTFISGFVQGADKIDLTGIAKTLGQPLAFSTNTTFAPDDPGQVESYVQGNAAYVAIDATNGTSATFLLEVYDGSTPEALTAADLLLACYCAGTRIMTEAGEVAVEQLSIGDRVMTVNGSARPIKWIGQRSYAGLFVQDNRHVLPVCFKAGSLADGTPTRDLWVSPNHAMFIDGILIPAEDLVNGHGVVQANAVEVLHYFHIELESHDVILAEGAWSETFIDDDSRMMFHNAQDYLRRYPDEGAGPARFCAPRISEGYELEAIRERIGKQTQPVIDRLGRMA